jgi:selenocysteine lyase/cysteine desulfurase
MIAPEPMPPAGLTQPDSGPQPLTLADARKLFDPAGVYVNTASYGLPPRPAWDALQAALRDWRGGRTSWEAWGDATEESRATFARLVNTRASNITVGATVSELMGLVATALPRKARVVIPDIEFTSTLFPFLVQGRLETRTVPPHHLAEAIADGCEAVAFSAVQMSSGELADLTAIEDAARSVGALTLCDATQAIGWLPLDASRLDAVACGAYKWLLSPRGTAFLAVSERLLERVVPHSAGWYAGEDPYTTYFGPPLRLAQSARRLDTSPAWFSWVGTAPALRLLEAIGIAHVHRHDVALAKRFSAGLGLPPADSAIVSAEIAGGAERLTAAGIVAAVRGGRLRTSWHLYNTEADVDRVLDVLTA